MDLTDLRIASVKGGSKRRRSAHVTGIAVFLSLQLLALFIPNLQLRLFCEPSARVAAAFLGTPVIQNSESVSLSHSAVDVAVTEACSGFDFFALTAALLIGLAVFRQGSGRIVSTALFLVLAAYALTLFSNTSRIVCAVQIRMATGDFIPASFDGVIHQSIGVIVFVTILALSWTFMTRIYEERRTNV